MHIGTPCWVYFLVLRRRWFSSVSWTQRIVGLVVVVSLANTSWIGQTKSFAILVRTNRVVLLATKRFCTSFAAERPHCHLQPPQKQN